MTDKELEEFNKLQKARREGALQENTRIYGAAPGWVRSRIGEIYPLKRRQEKTWVARPNSNLEYCVQSDGNVLARNKYSTTAPINSTEMFGPSLEDHICFIQKLIAQRDGNEITNDTSWHSEC